MRLAKLQSADRSHFEQVNVTEMVFPLAIPSIQTRRLSRFLPNRTNWKCFYLPKTRQ